tara:strand:- start:139 stop:729 length:591 start_codon:yes stop_codon:yes gene_type:complete
MKHLYTLPICSNALFIYKLDIKDNLILKFKKEKFKPVEHGTVLISKDMNVLKKYNNLNKEIKKSVNKTLKEILMLNNINYKIFSSWLTKTEPKAFSESHSHTNSWLSGVYYPKGNPSFKIKFYNDNKSQFFTPPTKYNIYNSNEWTISPQNDYLIIFFSQLRHKIILNNSDENRYSLAFNLIPKGKFGAGDSEIIY